MKPTAIFKERIAGMDKQSQPINYELAERNARAVIREQSAEEEQASRLVDGFQPNAEDTSTVGWPISEENCPYAGSGMSCNPVCVYCDMQHVCMYCALKPRRMEASIDALCPFRIPGCRCSMGMGPKYFCSIGDPLTGAYALCAGDEENVEEEIGGEDHSEGEAGDEDAIEETEDDEFFEDDASERLLEEFENEESLNDENECEEFAEDEIQNLYNPQSLWPLSATFWNGLVPGWEQCLPPPPQPQADQYDCSQFWGEPATIDSETSVAATQYTREGRAEAFMDTLQLAIANDPYSPFLPESPNAYSQSPTTASQRKSAKDRGSSCTYAQCSIGDSTPSFHRFPELSNQDSEAPSQNAPTGEALYSKEPVTEDSWSQATHEQRVGYKRAAIEETRPSQQPASEKDPWPPASHGQRDGLKCAGVGEAQLSQQPASKKDSRGWEEHEKALVKTMMEEVISEGTHARTEERWKVISRRLSSRYSVDRTWTAVKNYWNRHGRSDSNIDERKVKNPDRMVTGVQDPESRRKARKLKRKDAESDGGNDLAEVNETYSDSARLSKRQRL